MNHTPTHTQPGKRQRRAATRKLLAHYRFRCAISRSLQDELEQQISPLLRAVLPLLPLIYGRRRNRFDHARRQLGIPLRRFALELARTAR